MEAATARDAKRIADWKINTHESDWNLFKQECIYDLLLAKLEQCPPMKRALVKSGHEHLIEDTNHKYWAKESMGQGINMLGTLLMIIHDGLQSDLEQSQTFPEVTELLIMDLNIPAISVRRTTIIETHVAI